MLILLFLVVPSVAACESNADRNRKAAIEEMERRREAVLKYLGM